MEAIENKLLNAIKIMSRGALSVEEAAKYLGKGRQFVERLILNGDLRFVKLDDKTAIPKFVLDDFLAKNLLQYKKVNKYVS